MFSDNLKSCTFKMLETKNSKLNSTMFLIEWIKNKVIRQNKSTKTCIYVVIMNSWLYSMLYTLSDVSTPYILLMIFCIKYFTLVTFLCNLNNILLIIGCLPVLWKINRDVDRKFNIN